MSTPFEELRALLSRIDPNDDADIDAMYDDWTVTALIEYILDFHRVGSVINELIGGVS